MMTFFRYSYAAPSEDGRTGTVVASNLKSARQKAWCKLIAGLPFLSYSPGKIVMKMTGPVQVGKA